MFGFYDFQQICCKLAKTFLRKQLLQHYNSSTTT
jgi:hypothetical protein